MMKRRFYFLALAALLAWGATGAAAGAAAWAAASDAAANADAGVSISLSTDASASGGEGEAFSRAAWQETPVAEGIILRQCAFAGRDTLFGSNQFLSVLIVSPARECALVAAPAGTLALTSALAAGTVTMPALAAGTESAAEAGNASKAGNSSKDGSGTKAGKAGVAGSGTAAGTPALAAGTVTTPALAAVNGSFFHMKAPYGGSTFSRINNVIVSENAPVENFRRDPQRSGAIVVSEGRFSVVTGFGPERTYEESLAGETILTAGPMLLLDGVRSDLHPFKFNSNRHPRTAFGIRRDGTLIFVVADGRNAKAAGLSMAELQQVMIWLGCRDAINLDGGGSSTMVVSGAVVNHPCDNRRFDADGERPVANAWVIR